MSSLPKPVSASRGSASLELNPAKADVHAEEHNANHWRIVWRFAIHACVGTLIFVIIALPAIGLNWLVEWLREVRPVDPVIVLGLRIPEYAILGADIVMFLMFLWKSGKKTIRFM